MKVAPRRLFVDCQVFQHNTWNRGMGRYTLKLLEAIDKEPLELTLILNKNIPIEKSRLEAIRKTCPSAKILYLKLSDDPDKQGGWGRLQEVCRVELDKQLDSILKPQDTYLIASNFSIRYCSAFPSLECNKALIFWDLTPYLQWSDYKRTPDFRPQKYFAQFSMVFEADQLWAISESAADEARCLLGIEKSRVTNIRGASIRNLEEEIHRPKAVPANAKFIISPSADGPHKNNENMVRAFATFNAGIGNKYKLVITSDFSDLSKTTLSAISADLIFSGHVSDGELGWLYEHCEALLFASKTEGLGLPILEAVGVDKKVICSDIKVFKEISEDAFYFADPYNVESITDALDSALVQSKNWREKKRQYAGIGRKFSWPTVAQTCVALMGREIRNSEAPGSKVTQIIWYADSDRESRSRDIAEMLYPNNPAAAYRAMRPAEYTYTFPSYLVDMRVATNALERVDSPLMGENIYIIDDSQEAAQLLLRSAKVPGLIIAAFPESYMPENIEGYLKDLFNNSVPYKRFIELLQLSGNQVIYTPEFSARGTSLFVEQVHTLGERLVRGDKN